MESTIVVRSCWLLILDAIAILNALLTCGIRSPRLVRKIAEGIDKTARLFRLILLEPNAVWKKSKARNELLM